jgi:hypothetical protein
MTSHELAAIQTLRDKGYAVAIWEPEDVGIANPRALEDQAIDSFPCGHPHKPSLMELESAGAGVFYYIIYTMFFQCYIQYS